MRFWQLVFQFQKEKIAPRIALRNTLGFVLPLAVGIALGNIPAAVIAAIGALNVSYSDSHDPYLQRARRMLAASGLVGLAVFVGAICGNHPLLAIPMAGAWAFAAGMLVALSSQAGDLGTISLVTLVVFAAKPLLPVAAALSGALALAGALGQTALALAFWPVRRYVPERRALADLYAELARVAAAPVEVFAAPPASAQSLKAQEALATLSDHTIDGERYRMLLSQAERTRLALFALGRLRTRILRESPHSAEGALVESYLRVAAQVMRAIGAALVEGERAERVKGELEQLKSIAEEVRERCQCEAGATTRMQGMLKDARVQMDAITGQLRAGLELAATGTVAGLTAFARQEVSRSWYLRVSGTLATLRANLSLQSGACRHAIRLGVCVALAISLGRVFAVQRAYWLPMTVAIVLKPDFSSTFSRGVLRLAGTFVGLIFATVLFHLLPASLMAQVAAMAALMFVMRCWGPANYGIFVTAVTGMVVLLVAMAGVPPKAVVAARGWNTALGGAIALAAYWLWPTWERTRVQDAMAQMLDAYREYFRIIRESYIQPEASLEEALDGARLAARRARSNLEASFDRMGIEPGTRAETLAAFSGMLASSHRLIHAIMALEAGLQGSRPAPARDQFRHFANDVEVTLHALAGALRGARLEPGDLPDLREDHHALARAGDPTRERYALVNVETDRVTNSLNTLSEEVLRALARSGGGQAR